MPRGSKPGERRGGRKRATLNKRTLLRQRITASLSMHRNATLRDLFLVLVNDPTLPAAIRLAVGRKLFAAERRRSRIATGSVSLTRDQEAAATSRESSSSATAEIGVCSPLELQLLIAQNVDATSEERQKAAAELAKLILPPRVSLSTKTVTYDFGFSVDPNLAKELRDAKLERICVRLLSDKLSPYAFAKKVSALETRISEIQQTLKCPCPSTYGLKHYIDRTEVDAEIIWDFERVKIFQRRRLDKETFTTEEDLEEAVRGARYDSFQGGPEMVARKRLADLRALSRAALRGGPPLTPLQVVDFRLLSVLYPWPHKSSVDETTIEEHPFHQLGQATKASAGVISSEQAA
jgi:hypothetical protein